MAKVRVDEFANTLGIEVATLIDELRQSNLEVSGPNDLIELEDAYQAHVRYQQETSAPPSPSVPTGTYANNTSTSTQAYGNNECNKTGTYAGNNGNEVHGDSQSDHSAEFCTTHNLGSGDQVELADGTFTIERVISCSRNTGEASVFQVQGEDQKSYALKLYYRFDDPRKEPNREALERISEINDPDILKLYAFGTGAKKYKQQYCYEISDLALGGTLLNVPDVKKKYTPEFVRSHVIPEIHKGILCLHDKGIFHCDIKPENIFYLDEQQTDLVIGDYGSAKTPETPFSHTSTVKGTSIYLAPEQAHQIISNKNDYYSFGMSLVRLLYPEMMDKEGLKRIYTRREQRKPILDFKPELSELNNLIGGLTLHDHENRWGADEVALWLKGEDVDVIYGREVPPLNLGQNITIRNDLDLIHVLDEENDWYEKLFAEQFSVDALCQWIGIYADMETARDFAALVRYYKNKESREYLREAALRFFDPKRPIIIPPKAYDLWFDKNLDDILNTITIVFDYAEETKYGQSYIYSQVKKIIEQLDGLWNQAKEEELRCYMLQLQITLNHLMFNGTPMQQKDAKETCSTIAKGLYCTDKPLDEIEKKLWQIDLSIEPDQLIDLAYKFNPDRGFEVNKKLYIKDIKEVCCFFLKNKNNYELGYYKSELKYFLKNTERDFLINKKLSDLTIEAFKNEIFYKTKYRIDFFENIIKENIIYDKLDSYIVNDLSNFSTVEEIEKTIHHLSEKRNNENKLNFKPIKININSINSFNNLEISKESNIITDKIKLLELLMSINSYFSSTLVELLIIELKRELLNFKISTKESYEKKIDNLKKELNTIKSKLDLDLNSKVEKKGAILIFTLTYIIPMVILFIQIFTTKGNADVVGTFIFGGIIFFFIWGYLSPILGRLTETILLKPISRLLFYRKENNKIIKIKKNINSMKLILYQIDKIVVETN